MRKATGIKNRQTTSRVLAPATLLEEISMKIRLCWKRAKKTTRKQANIQMSMKVACCP